MCLRFTLFTTKETRKQSSKRICQRITKLWSFLFYEPSRRALPQTHIGAILTENSTTPWQHRRHPACYYSFSEKRAPSSRRTASIRGLRLAYKFRRSVPREGKIHGKGGAWNIHPPKWLSPGVSRGRVRRCLLFTRKSSVVMQRPGNKTPVNWIFSFIREGVVPARERGRDQKKKTRGERGNERQDAKCRAKWKVNIPSGVNIWNEIFPCIPDFCRRDARKSDDWSNNTWIRRVWTTFIYVA